jgi:hypothetical protein
LGGEVGLGMFCCFVVLLFCCFVWGVLLLEVNYGVVQAHIGELIRIWLKSLLLVLFGVLVCFVFVFCGVCCCFCVLWGVVFFGGWCGWGLGCGGLWLLGEDGCVFELGWRCWLVWVGGGGFDGWFLGWNKQGFGWHLVLKFKGVRIRVELNNYLFS